jgi:opacity protein-like surface antigen
MKTAACAIFAMMTALPAAAQTDSFALRPYGLITYQAFSAKTTFEATFGQSGQPFWGAGAQLILPKHIYVDVSASRFKKTGERAFFSQFGVSHLQVAETLTITPFEIAGGYRFQLKGYPSIVPFAGAGVGWYTFTQKSDFSQPGEDVDTNHVGALLVGGVEFQVHRWIRLSGDVQYTHIPGILGTESLAFSTAANETDLGGVAARFKFIVGR